MVSLPTPDTSAGSGDGTAGPGWATTINTAILQVERPQLGTRTTGQYSYFGAGASGQLSTLSTTVIWLTPFYVPEAMTISGALMEVTTAQAAASVLCAFYKRSTGDTFSKVLDVTTFSAATTGVKDNAVSLTIPQGWVFPAFVSTVAGVVVRGWQTNQNAFLNSPILSAYGGINTTITGIVPATVTAGTLPASFTQAAHEDTASILPRLCVRKA
jgi:hypothetical protein